MIQYTPDHLDNTRPAMNDGDYASPPGWQPNANALAAHRKTAVARFETGMACMVGESLARESGEPVERPA